MDTDYCPWCEERADVYVSTPRRAAREHTCCECAGMIKKGETHELISMLYDGRWDRYRTCPACLRGPVAFVDRNCPGGRVVEGLYEHLCDVVSDGGLRSVFAEGMVTRWIDEARVRRRSDRRGTT